MSDAITNLKDLPKLFENRADPTDELLKMVREIHAAVCVEKSPSVSVPKKRYGQKILEIMKPGRVYIAEDFIEPLQQVGVETNVARVNQALIRLAKEGEITRKRAGIYEVNQSGGGGVGPA